MKTRKARTTLEALPARKLMHAPLGERELRMVAGGTCIEFATNDHTRGLCKVDYQCWNEP